LYFFNEKDQLRVASCFPGWAMEKDTKMAMEKDAKMAMEKETKMMQ
jgi:hypothetical protein